MSSSATTSDPAAPSEPPTTRLRGRPLAVLLVMCGAIFMEGIDVAMFGVALPAIRADLPMGTAELQWILGAYVLGYGGFVLVGGRAADLLGRRKVFLIALVVFLAFSGLGAIAVQPWMLITARALTGVAAAFLAPAGLSILTTTFTGPARDKAVLVYSGLGAGGFTIGLVLGGLLTLLGWRWVFLAPLVVSALLLVASLPLLPRDDVARRPAQRVDLVSGLILTLALVLLVWGIERITYAPVPVTVAVVALSGALLTLFVRKQRRAEQPLVRLGILRNRALRRANLGAGLLSAGFLAYQFVVVLLLQEHFGWGVLATSLALLLAGLDVVIAPTVTPKLVARFGHARVIVAGSALAVASYLLFLPVGPDWTYAAMVPSLVALGLAFSFAYGPLTIAATEGVAEDEQGLAGGLLYTVFQFGGAIGLSVATAVLAMGERAGSTDLETYRVALLAPVGFAVAGLLVALGGLRRDRAAAPAARPAG